MRKPAFSLLTESAYKYIQSALERDYHLSDMTPMAIVTLSLRLLDEYWGQQEANDG